MSKDSPTSDEVNIKIKAITEDALKKMNDVCDGLMGLGEAAKKTGEEAEKSGEKGKKSAFGWTELNSKINVVRDGVKRFSETLEKAFEFGKEGAAIVQTTESFDRLITSLGAAPDTLQRMGMASRGTVDDMTMMKSILVLAAGASDELARGMVEAAPKLMEIAKAANKLNPTLGDTAYMFDSLALGIKRSSPMILDNLGLTIKIGEANDEYAKKLGKTTDQLTAEEQKQALLNATLKAGDQLIKQVGGNVDSATDKFSRMEASLKNVGDEIKEAFVPILSDAAYGLDMLVSGEKKMSAVLNQHEQDVRKTAKSYAEYVAEMERARKVVADEGTYKKAAEGFKYLSESEYMVATAQGRITQASKDLTNQFIIEIGTMQNVGGTSEWLKKHYETLDASIKNATDLSLKPMTVELLAQQAAAGLTGDAYRKLVGDLLPVNQTYFELWSKVAAANQAYREGAIDLDAYRKKIRDARDELVGITTTEFILKLRADFSDWEKALRMKEELEKIAFPNGKPWVPVPAPNYTPPGAGTTTKTTGVSQDVFNIGGGLYGYYAKGADIVVPRGFYRDNYVIGVSSGERVRVTPPGQKTEQPINIYFYITQTGGTGDWNQIARQVAQILRNA